MTDILLYNGNFYYTRTQAITWMCNGSVASHSLSDRHFNIIFDLVKQEKLPLVINCHTDVTIEENALIVFLKTLTLSQGPVIFINIPHNEAHKTKQIIESDSELKAKFECDSVCPSGQKHQLIIKGKRKANPLQAISNLSQECDKLEQEKVKNYLANSYSGFSDKSLLLSTAITATGEFDAFKIIANPSSFLWITLRLSDLVNNLIKHSNFIRVDVS